MKLDILSRELKIKEENGKRFVLDMLRRKYVAFTPEEWVRQSFIKFLHDKRQFPMGLLANEISLKIGNKHLRADSVLYGTDFKPKMIMEYKAPNIPINQKVFDQISVYNLLLHVDYLVVSNGIDTYACKMNYEEQSYTFIEDIPYYENI